MKNIMTKASFVISLLIFIASTSWAGEPVQLAGDAENYYKNTLVPFLINSKFCDSFQDCLKHQYSFYAISYSEAIDFNLYGITDEKIIKEIIFSMLNSGLKIRKIAFYKSNHDEKYFFEKPIVEYINHSGDK